MTAATVLLVEDNPTWQEILRIHIDLALPGSDLRVVGTFQDGERELREGEWDVLVADIGLPPDADCVLGMQLVRLARAKGVPCVVVSGTSAVTKIHVRNLLLGSQYGARDYFQKEVFRSTPEE